MPASLNPNVTEADWERFNRDTPVGQCEYCGTVAQVKDEPFGQKPACVDCFFQIIDGED